MILTSTFGLLLLLGNPQPVAIPASILLHQAQEDSSTQNKTEQKPPQNEAKPAQADNSVIAPQKPAATTPVAPSPTRQQPASRTQTKPKPSVSRKKKNKATATRKPAKNLPAPKSTSVVVVRNGGTSDTQGQIASGTTIEQAPQQRKETDSLLKATASNLTIISGKELSPNRLDMVKQIRNYMQQSKDAARAGDIEGANNLAFKAHLLSEELVKH
jgi:hypothetical protein